MQKKFVYLFEEGNAKMRSLLGGKGANLAEMTNIGLPVPQGFTITTEACNAYFTDEKKVMESLMEEAHEKMKVLEQKTGKQFGGSENPLLVSVRSGSAFSMPGMMDTVLNLGLNDTTIKALINKTNNPRFAYDAYRRFLMMFGNIVLSIHRHTFEAVFDKYKKKQGYKSDAEVDDKTLMEIVSEFKKIIKKEKGMDFPQDPFTQLEAAIEAVFTSWNNDRAITYRNQYKIAHDLGTAVNVQSMVFGNMGNTSGTGVAFTRDPSTGEKALYGDYLVNAQGEDVVAGIRTPSHISKLKEEMPKIFEEFKRIYNILENHYRDMQDIEFTIEDGTLYMLQCRAGKRTAQAAVKIAVEQVNEKLISKEEALLRIDPAQLDHLLHFQFDPKAKVKVIARGLAASPGAASGVVVFTADEADEKGKQGEKVILVRPETVPDDIHGLIQAQGVLTARGGMTSHAAVVARGMGKPCVAGCESITIDLQKKEFSVEDVIVKEGDMISIDGSTGRVILGDVPRVSPQMSDEFKKVLDWADEKRRLKVRTNADTPEDAAKGFEFGAEGIGLCRTEHMFMAQDRLPVMQEMILAETKEERETALAELLPMQRQDFIGIFQAMRGFPVTIRLLDPPLHEFLPRIDEKEKIKELAKQIKITVKSVKKRIEELHEANPMLGLRGCRLGILYPEINEMQVRAIFEAACSVAKDGKKVSPEVMIPLIGTASELKLVREQLEKVAQKVMEEQRLNVPYLFGTMIEIPRAAVTADEIAEYAEFFSFGTNDLTQTTFGYSRDDAEGKFLFLYLDKKILKDNPFEVIDQNGVGKLMKMAVQLGRKVKPGLKLGICGEHGGDPQSVAFCHEIGLDYVSCSPYRVPLARLAAAQANIKMDIEKDK